MNSAPRDGRRIIIDAELASDRAENAFNDWVFAAWNKKREWWELSPPVAGTVIDTANAWLPASTADWIEVQKPYADNPPSP